LEQRESFLSICCLIAGIRDENRLIVSEHAGFVASGIDYYYGGSEVLEGPIFHECCACINCSFKDDATQGDRWCVVGSLNQICLTAQDKGSKDGLHTHLNCG
jgi:hypothetical protein